MSVTLKPKMTTSTLTITHNYNVELDSVKDAWDNGTDALSWKHVTKLSLLRIEKTSIK